MEVAICNGAAYPYLPVARRIPKHSTTEPVAHWFSATSNVRRQSASSAALRLITCEGNMRTDEEILDRINEVKSRDFLGFETMDLISVLPFEHAKQYLSPEVTEGEWQPEPRDRDSVIARMLDYMPFAWDKANNFRGISAGRSMCHYNSWIWLAGDDLGDMTDYENYGKDNLERICNHYGWDSAQWDDGVRRNYE
jgi:hypothetical protein